MVAEQQTYSSASFDSSNSMNPSSSDYTSNQSSTVTPHPSRAIEMSPFPFPNLDGADPDKRRSPVRRPSKLNLLSKLFSSSKRDLGESKKSVRDLGKNSGSSHQSTMKTASSTTLHLSRDAAQVFGNLRHHQGGVGVGKGKNRRGLVRQQSEDSMIGSVLEIPSSSTSSSWEDLAHEEVCYEKMPPTTPPRPKMSERAVSFRVPPRSNGLHRNASVRSLSIQNERTASATLSHGVPSRETTPSSNTNIEISPGNFQTLRGHKETLQYVREDKIASTTCLFCSDTIYAINDAAMVVCCTCRSITPMQEAVGDGHGLALGFSAHEWLEIQREALAIPPP